MKKIYTLLMGIAFCAMFSTKVQAQCAAAIGIPLINYEGTCRVVVFGSLPNATLKVFNSTGGDITIGTATTDANGAGAVFFNCNSSAAQVIAITGSSTCIAFVTAPIVFPIKLKSFTGNLSGSSVQLKWTSSLEINAKEFVVEKSSDGKSFTAIGTVAAKGSSTLDVDYGFTDKNFSGVAFYRLKLVDIDGKSEYSKVVYVNGGNTGVTTLSVFPNPFKSEIQLKGVSAADVNKQNIKVFNAAGKQVGYRINGSNSIVIDASAPQGVYILRVKDQTYKLFKSE